jgi:hypothetical protein
VCVCVCVCAAARAEHEVWACNINSVECVAKIGWKCGGQVDHEIQVLNQLAYGVAAAAVAFLGLFFLCCALLLLFL